MNTYESILIDFPIRFSGENIAEFILNGSISNSNEVYEHNILNIKNLLEFLAGKLNHTESKKLIRNFYNLYARLTPEEQISKIGVEIRSLEISGILKPETEAFIKPETEAAIELIYLNFSILNKFESTLSNELGPKSELSSALITQMTYFMFLSYGYGEKTCIDRLNRITIANNILLCASKAAIEFTKAPTKWVEMVLLLQKACEGKAFALSERKKALRKPDTYGFIDESKWIAEVNLFAKKLMLEVATDVSDPLLVYVLTQLLTHETGIIKKTIETFELDPQNSKNIPNQESNHQKGVSYEEECFSLLKENKWDVIVTPSSGDMGVDILGLKHGLKVAFQCKNWSAKINSSSVQEVFTGKKLYDANLAIIIAETELTSQAKEMSEQLGIICISKDEICSLEGVIIKHLSNR